MYVRHCKRPLFLMSNYWDPYIICSLFFKKWHTFCSASICRFIFSPARNTPPSPRVMGPGPLSLLRYDIAFAYHDLPDQAAFLVAVADATKASNVAVLSYWAFSDVFEEYFFPVSNVSFHGAFGLVNLNDVPKPSYRALQLLREAGDVLMRYAVANRSAAGGAGRGDTCRTTAGVIPTRASGTGDVLLLLYNHATYGTAITDCRVRATIRDVDARRNGVACATLRRIDADHANPLRLWEVMGAPNYTTALQDQQLRQSSEMIPVPIRGTVSASPQGLDAAFELTLPAHGVAAITVPHQCE